MNFLRKCKAVDFCPVWQIVWAFGILTLLSVVFAIASSSFYYLIIWSANNLCLQVHLAKGLFIVGFIVVWSCRPVFFGIPCAIISEKAMAPHSSTLAWKIPRTEEPGRLQSMGSLRVGHDWATSLSLFTFMHWRRKWQPTPVFLPGESQEWGSLRGAVYGVAQSQTRLKWLSRSRAIIFLPWYHLSFYFIY